MKLVTRLFISHVFAIALGVAMSLGLLFFGARAILVENQLKVEREKLDKFVLAAHESAADKKKLRLHRFMRQAGWDPSVVVAVYVQPAIKARFSEPPERLADGLGLLEHFEGQNNAMVRRMPKGNKVRFWWASVKLPGKVPGQVGLAYDLQMRNAQLLAQLTRSVELIFRSQASLSQRPKTKQAL